MAETVMGIDPSLTGTAVVVLKGDKHRSWLFSSEPKGERLEERWKRYEDLIDEIIYVADKMRPRLIVIERYFVGRSAAAVQKMYEFGTLLRDQLFNSDSWDRQERSWKLLEVAPQTWKKLVTGSGNANKTKVVATITKRFGVEFGTEDEYDAFAMAWLGRCLIEEDAKMNAGQRKIVEALCEEVC